MTDKSANRKQLLDDRDEFLKKYITEMTWLVNSMYTKNKRDDDIITLRDRFLLAKKENPVLVLELSGAQIWKYREEIRRGDVAALLKNDYSNNIAEISGTLPDVGNFEQIPSIIEKVKRTWRLYNETEQTVLKEKFKSILGMYASYVAITKRIEELASE